MAILPPILIHDKCCKQYRSGTKRHTEIQSRSALIKILENSMTDTSNTAEITRLAGISWGLCNFSIRGMPDNIGKRRTSPVFWPPVLLGARMRRSVRLHAICQVMPAAQKSICMHYKSCGCINQGAVSGKYEAAPYPFRGLGESTGKNRYLKSAN